jgi:hypothetical protein
MQVPAALSGLTALRSLRIDAAASAAAGRAAGRRAGTQQQQHQQQDSWLQPLSSLSQLTSLSISNMRSVKALAQLPAQLQQLNVQFESSDVATESCSLCNLTALTELDTNYRPIRFEYRWSLRYTQCLAARLLLPGSLRLLTLCDVTAPAPLALLGLQQVALPQELQQPPWGLTPQQLPRLQLHVRDDSLPDRELRRLSSLTGLNELGLTYSSISTAAAAAAAWGVLPLRQLTGTDSDSRLPCEQDVQLPASAIKQLTGVTSLTLANCRVGEESLRAISNYCKALQELILLECRGVKADVLTAAVVKLQQQQQQLRRLGVTGTVSTAELAVLARLAPQLQLQAASCSTRRSKLANGTSESERQMSDRWLQFSARCIFSGCQVLAPQLQLVVAATVAVTCSLPQ